MTAPRSTRESHAYQRQRRKARASGEECPFCAITSDSPDCIEETSKLRVIRNIAPYSIWDGQSVKDHLMIIPKKHTDKLGSLDDVAAVEFLRLIDKYEERGYNIFARAPRSIIKSVVHQHTHLIQPGDKRTRFILYLSKPFYIRLSK